MQQLAIIYSPLGSLLENYCKTLLLLRKDIGIGKSPKLYITTVMGCSRNLCEQIRLFSHSLQKHRITLKFRGKIIQSR